MRGLWRCHAASQRIIWLALEGDLEHSVAFACQISKALHQVALDNGDCSNALPMIPVEDILQEARLGGEEVEMEMILSYIKALRGIETQQTVREPREEEDGVEEGADGGADPSNQQKKRAAWVAKQKARAGQEK